MRWRCLAAVFAVAVVAGGAFFVFWYEPLVLGSIGGRDDHLLIRTRSMGGQDGDEMPIYEYQFHAGTSYYTGFSVRNDGPIPVTVLGIATQRIIPMEPSIEPAELLVSRRPDDPNTTYGYEDSTPLAEGVVVQPGFDLGLWIRWEIGPCAAKDPVPYEANSGVSRDLIPLRWSMLGVPRTSDINLGYVVSFEVTKENVETECEARPLTSPTPGDGTRRE
jgi:hypothetical protein